MDLVWKVVQMHRFIFPLVPSYGILISNNDFFLKIHLQGKFSHCESNA